MRACSCFRVHQTASDTHTHTHTHTHTQSTAHAVSYINKAIDATRRCSSSARGHARGKNRHDVLDSELPMRIFPCLHIHATRQPVLKTCVRGLVSSDTQCCLSVLTAVPLQACVCMRESQRAHVCEQLRVCTREGTKVLCYVRQCTHPSPPSIGNAENISISAGRLLKTATPPNPSSNPLSFSPPGALSLPGLSA